MNMPNNSDISTNIMVPTIQMGGVDDIEDLMSLNALAWKDDLFSQSLFPGSRSSARSPEENVWRLNHLKKALAKPNHHLIKAIDAENGNLLLGYAQWHGPEHEGKMDAEKADEEKKQEVEKATRPSGMDQVLLDDFLSQQKNFRKQIVGDRKIWCLYSCLSPDESATD